MTPPVLTERLAAVLAAVLDRPDDDTPRLVFADELDDAAGDLPDPDGARGRAEFIRVQCELARLLHGRKEGEWACRSPKRIPGHRGFAAACGRCDVCVLMERERETRPGDRLYLTMDQYGYVTVEWRRGFVEQINGIAAADWLRHADAITAAHPIRAVRLEGWLDEPMASLWLTEARARVGELRLVSTAAREFLEPRWPGITFELPPASAIVTTGVVNPWADYGATRTPQIGEIVRLADGTQGILMADVAADGTVPVRPM